MRSWILWTGLGAGLALVSGCRTTAEVLADYEKNLTTGAYAATVPEVTELAAKSDDTRLLWQLLAGAANDINARPAQAIAHYDAAEEAIHRNDQTSVFGQGGQGALAMMTNDRAFPYDGGGEDRIFTCLYKAIDYLAQGRIAPARTELNRAAQYQDNWVYDRRRDIEAASDRLKKEADEYAAQQDAKPTGDRGQQTGQVLGNGDFAVQVRQRCGFDPATGGDLETLSAADYVNTFAQHVTGVFRWINGDGGTSYLNACAKLAPDNRTVARDASDATKGVKPQNQVWIWVEDGLCPAREEWRLDLPLFVFPGLNRYVLYAGMALPVLRERSAGAANWQVQTGAGTTGLERLTDVDHLVRTEYQVYMRGALTREITRTIVKVGVQIALGAAADHTKDSRHQLALRLAQAGVAAWAASTTAADVRSWTALPKSVYAVRIDRPADGKVTLVADGHPIALDLPAGNSFVFVRKPGPLAAPVVRPITFPN